MDTIRRIRHLKRNGCDAGELWARGYSIEELRAAGIPDDEIRGAGFRLKVLLDAGIGPKTLVSFDRKDLDLVGATVPQLKALGVELGELLKCYSVRELKAGGYTPAEMINAGAGLPAIKLVSDYTCAPMVPKAKKQGIDAKALLKSNFSLSELRRRGYSPADLLDAGCCAKDIRLAGYSMDELRASGL